MGANHSGAPESKIHGTQRQMSYLKDGVELSPDNGKYDCVTTGT